MADTNLFALNELLEKIKAGEGTAKTNLEALNALCILSGGQGGHKTNLDALNEILAVFSPASPSQEKNLAITENGAYEVIPDKGYVLSKVGVSVDVPAGGGEVKLAPYVSGNLKDFILSADLSNWNLSAVKNLAKFLQSLPSLEAVTFPKSSAITEKVSLDFFCYQCSNLPSVDLSSFNFLGGISSMGYFAREAFKLTSVTFGPNPTSLTGPCQYAFYNCYELETCDISAIDMSGADNVSNMFTKCSKLKNLKVRENFLANGKITNFSLANSPNLTHTSIIDLINCLAGRDNSPNLALGSENLAKLTDEEKAIATDKGWTLS